jgi:hypothetical protein
MSDRAPDPRPPNDADDDLGTELLLDLIDDLTRSACESPFPNLYDTFLGGTSLTSVKTLVRAGRFRILWSETEPDRGERHIGYFLADDVDEDELVSMTRMLSGLTPRADEPESPWDDEDDEDEDDQDTNPELTATVRQFLEVRDAQHARLVSYAQAALQGLLANGLNSHPSNGTRHDEVAREAWAHAHAMLRLDPDYGSAPDPDETS